MAAARAGSVLLQTARTDAENRKSLLFTNPAAVLHAQRLEEIAGVFAGIEQALRSGRYVAGFLSYEAGYHFDAASLRSAERLRSAEIPSFGHPGGDDLPLAWFGVYETPVEQDELANPQDEAEWGSAEAAGEAAVAVSLEEYTERIGRIQRYIEAGDLYQANFTMEVRLPWSGDARGLFERMLGNQPVAYGALVNTGNMQIVSASPELFFRKRGDRVTVRPMKGTARRGRNLAEDAERVAWLAADEKNRAENVMIVDLLRNDLGRICRTGSVEVTELFAIERYPDLLQMTSTVEGELRTETSWYEVFRALFPCGSITGAPKIRTMQVIRELEDGPREIGCGAIGYFDPDGGAVFSVAIRTAVLKDGEARMRVGSGITWDSDAASEYAECLLKAQFLTRTSERFELIETMLWSDGYFLLDLHLERLRDSATYFDFRCEVDDVRAKLIAAAASFPRGSRQRVRLLLSRAGRISITSQPLELMPRTIALMIADARVDSSDRFLRHKTTRRAVYDTALKQARALGFDDALFLNERGEVTECAVHNVVIAKGGRWRTPALDCGVLPGVYRRYLRSAHPEVEEALLTLEDVVSADRVYVFNSVRGLRRVRAVDRTDRLAGELRLGS